MPQDINKTTVRLRIFLFISSLLAGLLAGEDLYRYVIEVPAWRHLSIITWAEYSRHADLGKGIFLFPIEAAGNTILQIAASIIVLKNKPTYGSVALPIHLATIFSITGLVFTFFAAPLMLHLRTTDNGPRRVQQTFNQFHFWGLLRAIAQILSFFNCLLAMKQMPGNEGKSLNYS